MKIQDEVAETVQLLLESGFTVMVEENSQINVYLTSWNDQFLAYELRNIDSPYRVNKVISTAVDSEFACKIVLLADWSELQDD